ncbi:MAG: hypothetical protein JXR58_02840 [Bacteroidales bacterium]|nr:hypothetical protein [Bacteroidales bacterium]
MSRLKLLAIFLFVANILNISAQEQEVYKVSYNLNNNILKTNPLTPLWGPINLTGEYRIALETRISMKQSIQIGASYLDKSLFLLANEDEIYEDDEPRLIIRGFRFQLAYRIYLIKNDFTGWYFSPMASYASAKFSYPGYIDKYFLLCIHGNVNFLLGYQYEMAGGLYLDVFGGLGIRQNVWQEYYIGNQNIIDSPEDFYPYSGNLKISLGFNVGFGF